MKVAEYIADFIASISPRVYGVCGAGAMHLNDAIANHSALEVITMHHEQAATFAAEADARVNGGVGIVMVTAGPGGTNTLTGVSCAFVDSIPMMIIAGQVTSYTMAKGLRRQGGMNELPLRKLMAPVTKASFTIRSADVAEEILHAAYEIATNGRPGPVFIEVPLDIQAAEVKSKNLTNSPFRRLNSIPQIEVIRDAFIKAKRPVILFGNGVRLSGAIHELKRIADLGIVPMVASWGAADILPSDHPSLLGRCGIFGDRRSNYAVYNSDFLLVIGSRLSPAQTGHTESLFAPNAKIAMVDIDQEEVGRSIVDIGDAIDAKVFLEALYFDFQLMLPRERWIRECFDVAKINEDDAEARGLNSTSSGINAYAFTERLASFMAKDAVVVTDVGFSCLPVFQDLKLNGSQRLIHSAGVMPMGWGIPAAIGAAMKLPSRQVICLTGDGGAMMNIQELQTIAHYDLPITIFVFENNGYATMRIAQNAHFNREVMSSPDSGLTMPNFSSVAAAFGIKSHDVSKMETINNIMKDRKESKSPCVVVMHMQEDQLIAPRLQAKLENGKFKTPSFNDLWPYKKGKADVEDRAGQLGQKILGAAEGSDRLVARPNRAAG